MAEPLGVGLVGYLAGLAGERKTARAPTAVEETSHHASPDETRAASDEHGVGTLRQLAPRELTIRQFRLI